MVPESDAGDEQLEVHGHVEVFALLHHQLLQNINDLIDDGNLGLDAAKDHELLQHLAGLRAGFEVDAEKTVGEHALLYVLETVVLVV